MAGIGFVLRKLAAQNNFLGIFRAFFHSTVVAVGPWIMVVVTFAFITLLVGSIVPYREVNEYMAVIIYNFFFSFIFSAPIYMIAARFVADSLYLRDLRPIIGVLSTSIFYFICVSLPLVTIFYIFFAKMTSFYLMLSIVNFILLGMIWIVMLFLTSIRNYRSITYSWLICMTLVVFFAVVLGRDFGVIGLLLGTNIGLVFLLFAQTSQIYAEYSFAYRFPTELRYYFKYYQGLFWTGFFLFGGLWIDKVIMWTAPEGFTHLNGLRTCPLYDGAMFFAYLTIIPVMSLFIFSLETNFYDSYIRYIQDIERNAPLSVIDEQKKDLMKRIIHNGRTFLTIQGSVSFVAITLAPMFFIWMKIDFLQLSIFRLGTIGSFFAALNLFIVVIFSYFDNQQNMMKVSVCLFFSNVILTLLSIHLGFNYYGIGYSLSMIFTFALGAILLIQFMNNLTYHIFVSNVVKRKKITELYKEKRLL